MCKLESTKMDQAVGASKCQPQSAKKCQPKSDSWTFKFKLWSSELIVLALLMQFSPKISSYFLKKIPVFPLIPRMASCYKIFDQTRMYTYKRYNSTIQ